MASSHFAIHLPGIDRAQAEAAHRALLLYAKMAQQGIVNIVSLAV